MLWIDEATVRRLTPMPQLIAALRAIFSGNAIAPPRHVHEISDDTSLLLMPAWRPEGRIGVKIATVNRETSPAVKASYLLIDGDSGIPEAMLDGAMLTSRRTAAASALAADYLAQPDARTLLIVGTGKLAPHLIEAHAAVRPIQRVIVWGRSSKKAAEIALLAHDMGFSAEVAFALSSSVLAQADIISVATLSTTALVYGATLSPGTHVDLVGAFRPDMCEADPTTFARARVFVDTHEGVLEEAGDLLQAIAVGALSADCIEGDLASLCGGRHDGRNGDSAAITLFKSVGSSLEDLACAELVVDAWHFEHAHDEA
jgi:ornithine cyclodeaminase/alanine dehydrogenase-like protein (mu-crystallin family)